MVEFYTPLRTFELGMPSRVIFGIDTVKLIGKEAKKFKTKNLLIITDVGVSKAGLVDKVKEPLFEGNIKGEVWDLVETEPSINSVENLLAYVKNRKFDLFIGVGGGSCMDVAKAAAVLVNNPGNPEDYFFGGKKEFSKSGIPCITVPTTSGTGAEITWDAVIKDRKGIKAFYEHQYIRPNLAIVDPIMSSTMPPKLTASSGIDALSHAIESMLTKKANPITQALAIQSIRLISSNLRTAVYHGNNIEARYNMALATLTGAYSETNAGDVEAHAIGHLIGSIYHLPHGLACGIALPYAMEFNISVSTETLVRIADAMGENINGLTKRDAAYKGVYSVRKLIKDVELPTTLKEIGIKQEEIPKLAEDTLTIPWIKIILDDCTKRQMTNEDALKLLENMWEGKLGEP